MSIIRLLPIALLAATASRAGAEDIDFNRDVRPVIAENCFQCHGPDAAARKADLRFDVPDAAVEKGVIVPGDAAGSEVFKRIASDVPDYKMPPPDSNLALSNNDVAVLRRWMDSGAAYAPHWAFVAPKHELPPSPADPYGWVRNPIDAFVLDRLNAEGIAPSPEADRETWLRRVSFDLTGLPPSIDSMDAFLADSSDDARSKAVEQLLDSPAYGERMAVDWLDAARYADTYGYQNDKENRVWPWRDWVIRAFNENLPYDDFITWQVAGDLLPGATQDQVIATAFNRLHRQTNEGGSVLEEFRVEYVADRTQTFATAFLGLTMECARCHDHKFDPISQRDYYSLFAFFNSIDESGMYSHFTDPIPSPSAYLYKDGEREQHEALKTAVAEREQALAQTEAQARARFTEWLQAEARVVAVPDPMIALGFNEVADGQIPVTPAGDVIAKLQGAPALVEGVRGQALQFDGDNGLNIEKGGKFDRAQAFTFSLWLKMAPDTNRAVVLHRSMAAEDAANRGYELVIEEGRLSFSLCHFWPGNAIRVTTKNAIAADEWVHVGVTYDGSSRADGVTLYVNGSESMTEVIRDNLYKTILYEGDQDGPPLVLASRFRDAGLDSGSIDELAVYDRALTALEVRAVRENAPIVARGDEALAYYLARFDAPYLEAQAALQTARAEEAAFANSIPELMVMQDLPEPRPAYVLARGAYDQRGEAVGPDTPDAVLPFPEDLPKNRLGLARWMTDPANPLTARVAVNRIWRVFFGNGLVETQEDFGTQGAMPSHPALLDWLAAWFVDNDWDVQALCRLIADSAAYRQASDPRPELQEVDPFNRLLARGPRYRLPAEQVRDAALASSGLLVPTIGGPSVKPYQPADLWKDASQVTYEADTGEGLYRRSMYTFWKRTVPPPSMLTFDAPSRETCVVRREETSTPLQALTLLNGTQFVEAARVLAEEVLRNHETTEERVTEAVKRLLGRKPRDEEVTLLREAYEEQRALFGASPEDAIAYISVGAKPRDEALDAVDVAAMTAVVQAIMNFDRYIMKS